MTAIPHSRVTKLAYYRQLARELALKARRARWMQRDPTHELWAERARQALWAMRQEIAEEAKR